MTNTARTDHLARLETTLRDVVTLAETLGCTGVELLENLDIEFDPFSMPVEDYDARDAALLTQLLAQHTTHDMDVKDLVNELLDFAGSRDDDNYNE